MPSSTNIFNELNETNSQRAKTLEGESAINYLSRINFRLSDLKKIPDEQEGDDFILPFIKVVKNSIEALILKHQIGKLDEIDFPLTIFPKSGFPTETDFYCLEKNKKEADQILEALPNREEIIDRIRRGIHKGYSIVNNQIMLKRFNYYSKLKDIKILEGYSIGNTELKKQKNGSRYYTTEWSCIERTSNLPVYYRMFFNQDSKKYPFNRADNPKLETIIYQTQVGLVSLDTLARTIDNEIEEIHPKQIYCVRIGPYYDQETENSDEINKLLEKDKNSSILKFSIEMVASEKTRPHYLSFWDRFIGKKIIRESYGPLDIETRIITSFKTKQIIGNTDEYGNPCKVYGVTNSGDVV